MTLTAALQEVREKINERLRVLLPVMDGPEKRATQAMRYACIGTGKALRPFLVFQGGFLAGADEGDLLDVACAIEMVHSYSLVHDDLPAMDNDTLRRGKPTCHIEFDEATAILAGDGLLTKAFEVLSAPTFNIPSDAKARLVYLLARSAGHQGMIAGQMLDLIAETTTFDTATVSRLQRLKTGALFHGALQSGVLLGHLSDEKTKALDTYADCFGLLFQITDDLLDKHGSAPVLGKSVHKDEQAHKATFLSCLGEDKARQCADTLARQAKEALTVFEHDKRALLNELIDFTLTRQK